MLPSFGSHPELNHMIIGIGASTGGTEAILAVLRVLPEDTPAIIIVQHMPPEGDFTALYAERLNGICRMEVREARDGDIVRRGCAYIAPSDYHVRIEKKGGQYILACSRDEKCNGHRPSVDVLFHSMAQNVTCSMIGIIMTGMGNDGAAGLLAMRRKGAYTVGQDEESSVVYGMPKEAFKMGAVVAQVPCDNIAALIYYHIKNDYIK